MFDPTTKAYLLYAVIGFFVFIVGFSILVSLRIKTYDDYNVAGRNVSLFPLMMTVMGTAIGGATLLGFTTSGYMMGIGRMWELVPAYIIQIFMVIFMLKVVRNIGNKYNMITIPDFTALRFGEPARLPSTIALLFAYCAIAGLQYVAIATFLSVIFDLNMTIGIFIGWVLLTAKTYLGGLKAVIWADSIQGSLQNIGIIVVFIVLFSMVGGYSGAAEKAVAMGNAELMDLWSMPFSQFLVFFFTLGAYQIIRQDIWQRMWAAKNMKIAKTGFWLSAIFGMIFSVGIFSLGTFGRIIGVSVENPALAFYAIAYEVLPTFFLVIAITAVIATIISCADSFLVAGASSVVNDILKPMLTNKDDQRLLQLSRYSVLITSVVALVLALYIPQLVRLWVTGTAMLTSGLMLPVLAALFWKGATNKGGLASMWGGLTIAVAWELLGHPFGIHPVFVGLPTSLVLLIGVSMFTKPSPKEIVDELSFFKNTQEEQEEDLNAHSTA